MIVHPDETTTTLFEGKSMQTSSSTQILPILDAFKNPTITRFFNDEELIFITSFRRHDITKEGGKQ